MPRAALLASLCLAIAAAGCGGGAASGGDDPASAVPRDAALYLDATVRPSGELRDDALAAAGKVLRTADPQGEIDALVAKAFAESEQPKLDYARDVEPWLGEKVALWAAPTSRDEEFRGAVVASATDADAARAAIARAVDGSDKSFSRRNYEGVEYQAAAGSAAGVVEDFAVFGTEAEFKRTVDAVKGDGLDSGDRFRAAIDDLEEDRLGTFYVDVRAAIDQAVRQDPDAAEQLQEARRLFPIDEIGPVAGAFAADGERLAIDAVADVPEDGALGALTRGGTTPLLGELPGDAWAAFGAPGLGATAKASYEQAAGALGSAAIAQQLRSELGIDLQEDVFSWVGDAAVFARGTSKASLEGGVVIEVTDAAKGRGAFGKLIGLLQSRLGVGARPTKVDGAETAFELAAPGMPRPAVAARSEDRVVIASSGGAAADALAPDERLADSDVYAEARSVLGDDLEPSMLLSMPDVLELATSSAAGDAHLEEAKPYLEAFSVLAGGSGRDGGQARSRFAAGIR